MDDELLLLSFNLDLSAVRSAGDQVKAMLGQVKNVGGLTAEWVNLKALDKVFSQFPETIKGGVKLSGPAAAYGLVWEWGRVDINPGPKTKWSTNADGQEAVLTIQAPHGWIRVKREDYLGFLRESWGKVNLTNSAPSEWVGTLHDMLWSASSASARLMEDTAPYDTGDLRSEIIAVNEPDPILEEGSENDFGPTDLQLGSDWL